ncbi:MAG TPA: IS1182 family transposase [Sphingomicrobium sp.]|nr:IS1182 family transposase [Sphingomicrobium sp.]
MSGKDGTGLFDELAEQAAPPQPVGGRPRLRQAERGQVEMRALSLDELVPADHRVRQVWAFSEQLDLSCLYDRIRAVEGRPGHPPADPRILLALWLYATIEGVGSARALARLCREHVAFQWLCGGVSVNHKTLGDFRVDHGDLLERLLVDGFAALLRAGVVQLQRVAQDGMRVRAAAGAASFRRLSTLEQCQHAAAERVRQLKAEVNDDPGAASRRHVAAQRRAAEDRQRRVTAALAVAEQLDAARRGRGKRNDRSQPGKTDGDAPPPVADEPGVKEPRASTTDSQARVMKMADGGYRPAYNAQFATDTGSGLIAGLAVDNVGSDMGKLRPMSEQLAHDYGIYAAEHLVDGGFVKLDDLNALHAAGVVVFAPVPAPRDRTRDRYAPLPEDPPGIAAWRVRMAGETAKAVYRERAASAECTNAHARNRGLVRFTVRGIEKVKAVLCWYALAHNMACLWRLTPA